SSSMIFLFSIVLYSSCLGAATSNEDSGKNHNSITVPQPRSVDWCMKDLKKFRYCPAATTCNRLLPYSFHYKYWLTRDAYEIVEYLSDVFNITNTVLKTKLTSRMTTSAASFACEMFRPSEWPLAIYEECPKFAEMIFESVIVFMHTNFEMRHSLEAAAKNHSIPYNVALIPVFSASTDNESHINELMKPWNLALSTNKNLPEILVTDIQKTLRTAARCILPPNTNFSDYLKLAFEARFSPIANCSWTKPPPPPTEPNAATTTTFAALFTLIYSILAITF
ncbi:hypothetical protein PFISCL1PPCAC_26326, partial [Pristionchus fissidentatus]